MSQSKMHTDDLTVGGQQTTHYMCSVFITLAKITKKKISKEGQKKKRLGVWV